VFGLDGPDVSADGLNDADELVAHPAAGIARLHRLVRPKVAAANGGAGDGDECVVRFDQVRVGDVLDPDVAGAVHDSCAHAQLSIRGAAAYSSSVTWSPQVAGLPSSSTSSIARWVMKRLGAAPCQWSSPASKKTRSPGRITSIGPPRRWARPMPSVTQIVWPFGCLCHAVRAPGVKWTLPALILNGSDGAATASMYTAPVNQSLGPGFVSTPF